MSGPALLSGPVWMGDFYLAYEDRMSRVWPGAISLETTVNAPSANYPNLGQSPMMREWVGGRHVKPFRAYPWTLVNGKFEATVPIAADDWRRDATGQLNVRVNDLSRTAADHWAHLVAPLIANGKTGLAYHGGNYFSATQNLGDAPAQSNFLTISLAAIPSSGGVTGSTPNTPAVSHMQWAIMQAVAQILGMVGDRNEPVNEGAVNFIIACPIEYYNPAVSAVSVPAGTDINQLRIPGNITITVAASVRFKPMYAANEFAVFRADDRAMAFILQSETPPTLSMKGEDSDHFFDYDEVVIGTKANRKAEYGFWQHGCLVKLTA